MNKLEPNMYVRTKQGYIAKFKKYDETFNKLRFETSIFLRSWMPCDYMQKDRFMNRYFLKASHNIIDLIEEGDFVKVRIDGIFINYFMVDKFEDEDENIRLGIGCYEDGLLNTISEYRPLETLEILGIVTKQQFSSMEYRLGE